MPSVSLGMGQRLYFVYILASHSRVLYVGVTNDLARRLSQHRAGEGGVFTRAYRAHRLVYCEAFPRVADALHREKQIKGWARRRKVALIESANREWRDLADGWLPTSTVQ